MKSWKRIVCAVFFVIVGVFCAVAIDWYAKQEVKDIIVLRNGWTVGINDGEPVDYTSKDLSDFTFSDIEKGDILRFRRDLSDIPFEQGRLVLDTWHVVLTVYVGDTPIYTCGSEYAEAGKMVGNIRHYVDLPENYQNEELYLEMVCTEDNAMSGLMPVGIAERDDLSIVFFNRLFPLLVPAVLMLGVGFVAFIIGVLMYNQNNATYKITFLGLLLTFIGLYSLCRAQFIGMLIPNPLVYNAMEFCSLYILPFPLIHIFAGEIAEINNKYIRLAYKVVLCCCVVFPILTSVLHVTGVKHFVEWLPFFYGLILVEVAVMLIVSISFARIKKAEGKYYVLSIIMVMIGGLLAVFAFRLRYTGLNEILHIWKWQEYLFVIFFFAAGFFAAVALVMETSHALYDSMYADMYRNIAYTDSLTGLGNRRSFDEELQWLEKNKDTTSYSIVCFDLNDLKKVNDSMGHDAGDRLLKSFAEVLQEACKKEVCAYRIGGDEFVVVIRDNRMLDAEQLTERIEQGIADANKGDKPFIISAAYGFAKQGEDESVHKDYMLADERMYEKKAEMKKRLE